MAVEVEIKAWVDDLAALRKRVAARYPFVAVHDKVDVYYRIPVPEGERDGVPEFRLRVDGGRSIVTAKRKRVVNGVEINDEMEYEVSDPVAFERFAAYLGATVFARKHKVGDSYRAESATIELSHVEGLGDFVEIEWLLEEADTARIQAAETGVRTLLEELGVSAERIEPRYYVDLLAERSI